MGTKIYGQNIALNLNCDERKSNAECKLPDGTRMFWKDYIDQYHKDWYFDFSGENNIDDDEKNKLKFKNIENQKNIWKIIGPRVCEYYKNNSDNDIRY